MLPGYLADTLQGFATISCEMKRVQAPVAGIRLAFNELTLFKVVEDSDQPAGMDAERRRKLLLADSRSCAQQAQDTGIRR